MLVAVETDAVTQAVREELVAGTETGGSHDGARRVIHGAGKFPAAAGVQRGVLRAA